MEIILKWSLKPFTEQDYNNFDMRFKAWLCKANMKNVKETRAINNTIIYLTEEEHNFKMFSLVLLNIWMWEMHKFKWGM